MALGVVTGKLLSAKGISTPLAGIKGVAYSKLGIGEWKQGAGPNEASYRGSASGMRMRRAIGAVSALDAQSVNALAYHDLARWEAGYQLTRTGRPVTIAV